MPWPMGEAMTYRNLNISGHYLYHFAKEIDKLAAKSKAKSDKEIEKATKDKPVKVKA